MIMEEKEYAKAIINYFELYSAFVTIYDQDLSVGEETTKRFKELLNDINEEKININATHQQLVDELGTHIFLINQSGDQEYNSTYENIKKSFGIGKEEETKYGNVLINVNDESIAFNKLLSVIPTDEYSQELINLVNEKDVKKF